MLCGKRAIAIHRANHLPGKRPTRRHRGRRWIWRPLRTAICLAALWGAIGRSDAQQAGHPTTTPQESRQQESREQESRQQESRQQEAKPHEVKPPDGKQPEEKSTLHNAADPYGQTKPDTIAAPTVSGSGDHPQESPMAAIGDAWKMMLYLAPILLLTVGALRLLRRYQERRGTVYGTVQGAVRESVQEGASAAQYAGNRARSHSAPAGPTGGWMRALLGGFYLNRARERGGSSIRLVESVPVGGANLHLVEVRGRLLLLGATGSQVNLLTEFKQEETQETDEFHAMLHAAAADMDVIDYAQSDLPVSAMVHSLEDVMRETGESLSRRSRRLRTAQEEDDRA